MVIPVKVDASTELGLKSDINHYVTTPNGLAKCSIAAGEAPRMCCIVTKVPPMKECVAFVAQGEVTIMWQDAGIEACI